MTETWTSLGSSNPFRRRSEACDPTAASASSTAALDFEAQGFVRPHPPVSTASSELLHDLSSPAQHPPPNTSFQKPKVVKKVRVQSPPPSSPELHVAPPWAASQTHSGLQRHSADVENPFGINVTSRLGHVVGDEQENKENESDYRYGDHDANNVMRDRGEKEGRYKRGEAAIVSGGDLAGIRKSGGLSQGPLVEAAVRPASSDACTGGMPQQRMQFGMSDGEADSGVEPEQTLGKLSMDVDAFKRLLLTGQRGLASPIASTATVGDSGNITDASSISRPSSIFDAALYASGETSRTSHDLSDAEYESRQGLLTQRSSQTGKMPRAKPPPPPPNSRHGKLIKAPPKSKEGALPFLSSPEARPAQASPSDLNKQLLLAPAWPESDGGVESSLDLQAAGKQPEFELHHSRPPTPPKASHAATWSSSQESKKPLPPPRRHRFARADSDATLGGDKAGEEGDSCPPTSSRSSFDSTPSRCSSLRAQANNNGSALGAAPPPPPRRGQHAARPSLSSLASSSVASFHSTVSSGGERSPAESTNLNRSLALPGAFAEVNFRGDWDSQELSAFNTKMSPPPPPPARNSSVRSRRPPSVCSIESISRRVSSREKDEPPPPPPRTRGRSIDGPPSMGSKVPNHQLHSIWMSDVANTDEDAAPAQELPGRDVLADLAKLKAEVDALRAATVAGR